MEKESGERTLEIKREKKYALYLREMRLGNFCLEARGLSYSKPRGKKSTPSIVPKRGRIG